MTYGIIYVVENTINGKKYVGQTVQPLKVRWQRHCRKEQSGCVALASAIAKYGADAFKVSEVAQASTKEELNSLEAQLVVALGTVAPGGYNLRSGGGSHDGQRETARKNGKPPTRPPKLGIETPGKIPTSPDLRQPIFCPKNPIQGVFSRATRGSNHVEKRREPGFWGQSLSKNRPTQALFSLF